MIIEFGPVKSERNARTRDSPFYRAAEFDWETAIYWEDTRGAYGESRFVALGYLDTRLHVVCFTHMPVGVRIISFRKANSREIRRYENEAAD